jgi:polysaccharide deacetylase family protein (PEP-CTERM system associated)
MKEMTALPKGMLTLDVEDWYHANFARLEGCAERIASDVRAARYGMDANIDRWLEFLGEAGAKSTCFVLGEFARRFPHCVKKLAHAGHEIASHGDTHDLVYAMERQGFREFLRRGIGTLGDLTGIVPQGFRAPSWSVDDSRTPWFCEELEAAGIRYDSSEFPIRTPLYGQAKAPLLPYWRGRVLRIPVTVLTAGPLRLPFASGAFFRLAPLALIRFGLRRAARQRKPVMVVLHPRELDPAHPRLPLKGWEASVHYARLATTVPKLRGILPEFDWRTISDLYRAKLDTPGAPLDN